MQMRFFFSHFSDLVNMQNLKYFLFILYRKFSLFPVVQNTKAKQNAFHFQNSSFTKVSHFYASNNLPPILNSQHTSLSKPTLMNGWTWLQTHCASSELNIHKKMSVCQYWSCKCIPSHLEVSWVKPLFSHGF